MDIGEKSKANEDDSQEGVRLLPWERILKGLPDFNPRKDSRRMFGKVVKLSSDPKSLK